MNEKKYLETFKKALMIEDEEKVRNLKYQDIPEWDSVGHMGLVAEIEDAFDIMMETDDIIDFSSYEKGKEILREKYDVEF